jgi:hypothetical protein
MEVGRWEMEMEERRKKMGVRSWEFEGGKVDSEVRDQTSEIRESSEEVGKCSERCRSASRGERPSFQTVKVKLISKGMPQGR